MEFTPQEIRLINRLRKHDRQWRWARWLVLGMGVFSLAACSLFGYFLHTLLFQREQDHYDSMMVFMIVLIWTKCCFYFVFGIWCLITACIDWHGNVNRMLLLRLLDAQQAGSEVKPDLAP